MKRLLLDTCVLVDLTILELSDDGLGSPAYAGLRQSLQRVDSKPKRDRLVDYARANFGAVEVSTGVLLEMDGHAQRALVRGNRSDADVPAMRAFWDGYARIEKRLDRRVSPLPLDWCAAGSDRFRFGLVDDHLLRLLECDGERSIVTFDGDLVWRALQLAPTRVVSFETVVGR